MKSSFKQERQRVDVTAGNVQFMSIRQVSLRPLLLLLLAAAAIRQFTD